MCVIIEELLGNLSRSTAMQQAYRSLTVPPELSKSDVSRRADV